MALPLAVLQSDLLQADAPGGDYFAHHASLRAALARYLEDPEGHARPMVPPGEAPPLLEVCVAPNTCP